VSLTEQLRKLLILASAGANPMTPMSALALATYTRPRLRLIMPEDTDRVTPTDIAPPPSVDEVPITQPPGKLETMLPARTPSDFKEVAVNDVLAAQRQLQRGLDDLLGPGGRLEAQTAAIAAVVDNAAAKWDGTYRLLAGEMQTFRQQVEAKDREQDTKLERVMSELVALRARVEVLERERGGGRELSEVKSLLTALFLRMEMQEANGAPAKATLSGRVILVVENEDLLVRTLKRVLVSRGAQVLTARNFDEVRTELSSSATDCVLLDIRLEADDGMEIAKWLIAQRALPKERILLLTGHANPEHQAAAKRLGLVVLEKPIAAADLVAAILSSIETPSN
jgi:ActR/RegA family two-component response regulator